MPTARELLDQADALMRRNRLGAPVPPPGMAAEDGIPTLVDEVKVPAAEAAAPAAPDAPRAAPADLEDVPLLTDAVEEIEASSVLDEPDTADASMWSDTFTGVHSILGGEGPTAQAQAPAAPATGTQPAPGKPAPLHLVAPTEEWIDVPAPPAPPAQAAAAFDQSPEALPPPPEAEVLPLPAAAPPESQTPEAESIDISEPLLETVEAPHADDVVESPEPVSVAAAMPEPSAPTAQDDARWNALAEEIRMQVLQRIDLFTDTGLREQLAVRLQPIVDRASADLVATINQHVGILLRAYVSEAIEREIDRWRNQGH